MTVEFVFAAILIVGFIVIFLVFDRRIRRLTGLEGRLSTLRDEVEALAADFGEVSERNIGLLEDRIAVLRDLLDEATLSGPAADVRGADGTQVRESTASESSEFARPAIDTRDTGSVEPSGPIVLALGHTGSSAESGGRESSHAVPHARPARTEALDLFRAGFPAETIAARLGLSVAEIELIVGLEERRGA